MAGPLRFGVMVLQAPPYAGLADQWRQAEALGFESIWAADHLMQFPGSIAFEAWSLLGALARETTRVRIGAMVSPITFRHPFVLAMSATTIDHISGGRLEVGLGTGGGPKDQAALGLPEWSSRERVERLEEQLAVIDALLRGETVTHDGRHYGASDVAVAQPVQRPRPPLVIAAQSPRALSLVARYGDAWNTLGGQPVFGPDRVSLDEAIAETRRQAQLLDDACVAIGRDPAGIRRSLFVYKAQPFASLDAFEEIVARYREIGIDEFVFPWPYRGDPAVVAERQKVAEQAAREIIPRLRERAVSASS